MKKLTEKKHFNLIALHHAVSSQLVLNLLVAGAALLLLSTHSTTHLDGIEERPCLSVEGKEKDLFERSGHGPI